MSETEGEPAAMPPVIRYTLVQADYDAMMSAASDRFSRWLSRWLFWPLIVISCAISAWPLWRVAAGDLTFHPAYILNLLIAGLMLAGRYVVVPWMRRWALRETRLAGRQYEIGFGATAITLSAGGLSSNVNISEVIGFTETADYFFFWVNRLQAVIIPRRAIETPDGEAALRRYVLDAKWKER